MNQLKVEVSPADVLCMIPSVGLMAESKEELENVAHVVAVAFAKFYVSFPEAAEFLGVRFTETTKQLNRHKSTISLKIG